MKSKQARPQDAASLYRGDKPSALLATAFLWRTKVYFLLFMTFVHISMRPFFASLSGNEEMASMALSTYSWARARVCARPVLLATISRA
jgi:hypothetical protein